MLKIKEAVIVEGRYDKLKLSNLLDTLIVETGGFHIYKDKEKLKFIKKLASERGIIVLTDSDHSGFQIRGLLSSEIPKEQIKHLYIPDVFGKEKRKNKPSKEGKLGVEGIDDQTLLSLFEKQGIKADKVTKSDSVTSYDLYDLGFSGTDGAKQKKKKLLKSLDLPEFLSTSSLLSYINSSMTRQEFVSLAEKI